MLPILRDYLERLAMLHEDIKLAIRDLPVEALDWTPGPDMNSINALVTHAAGSERYWIGEVAGQDPSGRVRDIEFEARGLAAEVLIAQLDHVLNHSQRVLDGLSAEALGAVRGAERGSVRSHDPDDSPLTVAWALFHALEHTGLHAGQIQMTRQLWEQRGRS
jgi:uncharacterized damage-inducible protein DinB